MKKRKGILLAGGSGTRLYPITMGISKQLLPIYDKPMVYYPLSVLMLAGINEIAIITTPHDNNQYRALLGDGSQWGINLTYIIQPKPEGLAQAFILAEEFLNGSESTLILGDNIFHGDGIRELLQKANNSTAAANIFGYHVSDPERYGVIDFDANGNVKSIIEKPKKPKSNHAVVGLYFLDETAPDRAKNIKPSDRGELEITSLLNTYLEDKSLKVHQMSRGYAWLDTGTHASLLDAGNFVRTLQKRQGLQIGSPDIVAFENGWVSRSELELRSEKFSKNAYGDYLKSID
ncbi:glucose-1-phosphate thymidylyltransferase RfbA [Amylibacter sp.]|jgi:glucose-1-phosphate thymidylyltransferase|nr:glucose-1-phosphate thymidylyltransferase RfbA [Amylibacter sp.]MDA9277816.1 glucose-1-phosphate thymidylyltransferase RfbA [Amylibacter sp.]MDB4245238.1 glucose-1-phosphate thymidylyltransferase RfbA [Amylibacter sp.]MDB9697049.1 glucose-1-phosphate thymidylyltransferase RfbA [Amylibacter sp.]